MPPSVARLDEAQPPKPFALVSARAALERSASNWNRQALRVSFPRKRESSVVERRSGNMDARFRGRDADLGSTKMHDALTPRRGDGDSHPVEESGDGE